ncbi:MAG: hypothetical protein RR280_04360 [Bacteroidaceae bacterium]
MDKVVEYDYRKFIYFVEVSKKLHNVRRTEELHLHIALRGGEERLKEYIDSLK